MLRKLTSTTEAPRLMSAGESESIIAKVNICCLYAKSHVDYCNHCVKFNDVRNTRQQFSGLFKYQFLLCNTRLCDHDTRDKSAITLLGAWHHKIVVHAFTNHRRVDMRRVHNAPMTNELN